MKILQKIKALWFAIELVFSISAVVFLMWAFKKHIHKIRRTWARIQRFMGGYSLRVEGEMSEQAQILLINHTSMLDIVVLEEISEKNLCWIAKKEIGDLPILGQILKLPKMIAIDRKDPRAAVSMLRQVKERLSEGRVIAIFPEGTRGDGFRLGRFKSGAKMMIQKLALKAQPVLIVGSNILDSKNFNMGSGEIRVIFLPIVDTSDEDWLTKLRNTMQAELDKQLAIK